MEPKHSRITDVHGLFKSGSVVEISPVDEDLRGTIFTGKVIRHMENYRVLVEYDNLIADDSKSNPLKEIINLYQLRPPLPTEIGREFKLGDGVNAYHNYRWEGGHITKKCRNGRFGVYLKCLNRHIEFNKEKLRIHRVWCGGDNWVPPFKQKQEQQQDESVAESSVAESSTLAIESLETICEKGGAGLK